MTEGFLDRVANLIRGAALSFVSDLERANPEAVIQAAIDAQSERIGQSARLISRLRRYRAELKKEQEDLLVESRSLSERAAGLASQDEARALELLERKHALLDRVAEIKATVAETDRKLDAAVQAQETARKDLEALKLEKTRMLAERRSAGIEDARAALRAGLPANATDAALATLRARIEGHDRVKARLDSARDARRRKAREELESLRHAQRPAPRAERAADTPENALQEPPRDPPGGGDDPSAPPRGGDPANGGEDLPRRTL